MSCDIGCLTVLFHNPAECSCSIIQPCKTQTGKPNPLVLRVWSVGQWSMPPLQKKGLILQAGTANFSNHPLYFLPICFYGLHLKTSSFFFSKLIFSPFIFPHLAQSLSRAMLLKGFLFFCNEGSWCCQQCLAASPALPFHSGPARTDRLISKRKETPPSFTADSSHY